MELVQLFEDMYKHLAISSVWLIEKSKENDRFQVWDMRSCQLLWSMLALLQGINWDSSIKNVEKLESVSLAKWGSGGCL